MTTRFAYSTLRPAFWLRLATLAFLSAAPVAAQVDLDEPPEGEAPAEDSLEEEIAEEEDDGLEGSSDDAATPEDEGGAMGAAGEEKPAKFLLGARYRIAVVPQFLINMFGVEGGRTAVIHGGGPEFGFAQKDFEIILSPWFAGYSLESTPFKGPNDAENAWELVQSNLAMAYITADFLWKTHLSKQLDFTIGAGAGVGIVFGQLARNEAYWASAPGVAAPPPVNGDPYNTVPSATNPALLQCNGPGNPPNGFGYCPAGGDYGSGTPWPVYPWLTFQTGLRYSPVRNFVGRLDLGIGSSGFWFGLGADYGI